MKSQKNEISVGEVAKPESKRYFTHPKDNTLQAYKDWINSMVTALNPNAKDEMSEQEWEVDWREFWNKAKPNPE
jgi:sulfur relay (sulfurtransferase) DsrC/TusE family protein